MDNRKIIAKRVEIDVLEIVCDICSHCWRPRDLVTMPKTCPKCRSPRFDSGGRLRRVRSDKGVKRAPRA
jgi:Zn finger protein HypA/HybF involved in hydrogenase expression